MKTGRKVGVGILALVLIVSMIVGIMLITPAAAVDETAGGGYGRACAC